MPNNGKAILAAILIAACCASAVGREPGFAEYRAVQDSFRHLPPSMRFYAMRKAGLLPPPARIADDDTGSGMRLVGKWGGGPSVKVTGTDSLVFLSRGSEVVAINFADTASPHILSYIQAQGLVSRSILVGNRLYVGSTGSDPKYVEVFDVTDPANAVKLGSVQTMLNDIAVSDTLVYTTSDDSLKVFNFADPASPTLVGACRDSGYTISVSAGYAYLGDRWGLYVVDATNPASPHRVASWGGQTFSVAARGTICCLTGGNPGQPGVLNFFVLDVSTPESPQEIGHLDDAAGYDIYLLDSLAFLSGYYTGGHEFRILSIADSTHPRHVGTAATPDIGNSGVWADPVRNRAYVADRLRGLSVFDISNLSLPVRDTGLLAAGIAEDVAFDDDKLYVAGDGFGMTILDLSSPATPSELGVVDSTRDMVTRSVIARDSFAYMGWALPPYLKSIDVADPTHPLKAGVCNIYDWPGDMTLRDTLLYVAQRVRFQIVNVARPRAPVLVGSCVIAGTGTDLLVVDTLAYVSSLPSPIVNISNPAAPVVIGTLPFCAYGIVVVDTFALASDGGDSIFIFSVSDPTTPRRLNSVALDGNPQYTNDIELVGTRLYTAGSYVHVLDASNPAQPRDLARWRPPYVARRIIWSAPNLYVACWDAGVCVLETTAVAIQEPSKPQPAEGRLRVVPNPVQRELLVLLPTGFAGTLSVRDVAGRQIACIIAVREDGNGLELDATDWPAGVYFAKARDARGYCQTVKVVRR
jgi:hypothetical protein